MKHLYRTSEWQSESGYWYVADTSALAANSAVWWKPLSLLKLTPVEYANMLVDDFKAKLLRYKLEEDVFIFAFESQADARKYKNWINAKARKANYMI